MDGWETHSISLRARVLKPGRLQMAAYGYSWITGELPMEAHGCHCQENFDLPPSTAEVYALV